ncbi:MAG TPA: DUF2267 domain-containing protein [Candidatus Limnocylindrales bacterium]|nr:DUF2267 domain-containing protein [Candidatus Limnocylindrales bacterium]
MPETGLEAFDTTVQKTHTWLMDIMKELRWEDQHKAYLALRATLHTLRDRLTVEEAVQLGAQLPMLIRGFYYEGWNLKGKPFKDQHKEEFLDHIHEYFKHDPNVNPEQIARAVFKVLTKRISEGELKDIQSLLPKELCALWPSDPT